MRDVQQQIIPDELAGKRLDQALVALFPDYSRSRLQQWLKQGAITVDDGAWRPRDKVAGGERVRLAAVPEVGNDSFEPEAVALEVVHADAAIIVIHKPPGLVVHPATGNWTGTLMNGLLYHFPETAALPRAGIVHRLDKETSGLMVVARTLSAHKRLVDAMQQRRIRREYQALVQGVLVAGGRVEAPLGRHPVDRKRMAVVSGGKPALTHYRIRQRFRAHTLLEVRLETGRTHQIRVHMAHLRHPVVGDPVYGGRLRIPRGTDDRLSAQLRRFRRQALHAWRLALEHPETGRPLAWEAPLPADFADLLDALAPHSV